MYFFGVFYYEMREIIFYWYFRKFSDMVTGEVRLFDTSGKYTFGMGPCRDGQD